MIKLTITAKNGTTISLEIPTDGSVTLPLTPSAVSTFTVDKTPLQRVSEPSVEPVATPATEPELEDSSTVTPIEPDEPKSVDDINLETFEFPVEGGGTYVVGKPLLRDFLFVFSEPHVRMEFAKARSWLLANPTKMKTARGMGRYLNAWLHRTAGVAKAPIKERVQTTFATNGNQVSSGW